MTRDALFKALCALLPGELEGVIDELGVDTSILSPPETPRASRVRELLKWANQVPGRLAELESAYTKITTRRRRKTRPPRPLQEVRDEDVQRTRIQYRYGLAAVAMLCLTSVICFFLHSGGLGLLFLWTSIFVHAATTVHAFVSESRFAAAQVSTSASRTVVAGFSALALGIEGGAGLFAHRVLDVPMSDLIPLRPRAYPRQPIAPASMTTVVTWSPTTTHPPPHEPAGIPTSPTAVVNAPVDATNKPVGTIDPTVGEDRAPPPASQIDTAYYSVSLTAASYTATGKYQATRPGTATFVVLSKAPYYIDPEHSWRLTIHNPPSSRVAFIQHAYDRASALLARTTHEDGGPTTDADFPRADPSPYTSVTYSIPFLATEIGNGLIAGTIDIRVCTTDGKCGVVSEEVALQIAIGAAPPRPVGTANAPPSPAATGN